MKLSDKKRLQILDTAEDLFHRQGVEHTSMDQLAIEANVSKRTVYNHFATKEVLFKAITDRMITRLTEGRSLQFDPSQTVAEQLQKIAEDEVAMLSSDTFLRMARIAMLQMLKEPELAQTMNNSPMGCKRYLEAFLTDATSAGALKVDDVEFASHQFIYHLKAFAFYPALFGLHQPSADELKKIVSESVKMFLARYQAK